MHSSGIFEEESESSVLAVTTDQNLSSGPHNHGNSFGEDLCSPPVSTPAATVTYFAIVCALDESRALLGLFVSNFYPYYKY
jgi:hypothetical protein